MRNIKELNKNGSKVYVYLANAEIGSKFMRQAEDEGFVFPDNAKPTEREYANVMAVNADGTINYVGANGRIAFGAGAKNIERIDFAKYAAGEINYHYEKAKA